MLREYAYSYIGYRPITVYRLILNRAHSYLSESFLLIGFSGLSILFAQIIASFEWQLVSKNIIFIIKYVYVKYVKYYCGNWVWASFNFLIWSRYNLIRIWSEFQSVWHWSLEFDSVSQKWLLEALFSEQKVFGSSWEQQTSLCADELCATRNNREPCTIQVLMSIHRIRQ